MYEPPNTNDQPFDYPSAPSIPDQAFPNPPSYPSIPSIPDQPYPGQPGGYPSAPGIPDQAFPGQPGGYPPQQNYQYPPQQDYQYLPQQPQYQQPPMRAKKSGCGPTALIIVGVVVVIVAVLAVVIGSHGSSSNTGTLSSSSNNTGNSTSSTPAPTTASNQHFKVGDTVTVGNSWKVVVNSITTDDGGQYSALKSGDTYAVVDVSLTNLTSSEQTVSSFLMFTFKDSTGQKYDETIDTNVNGSTPDGKVAAGDTLRGIMAYEVPASQKSFTLAFVPDLTSSGQTIWDLSLS